MNLRDRLGIDEQATARRQRNIYQRFGVIENPFPASSQPMGQPHMSTPAEAEIEVRLKRFLDDRNTQAVVVEGTQGLGKTNLLEYYKNELDAIFADQKGYYIIRYYADPEPDFSGVVRRIIQQFGTEHLIKISAELADKSEIERAAILADMRGQDTRHVFSRLADVAKQEGVERDTAAQLALEYLLGLRVFKRHTEALGVQFRLDTTESKTQAFHDLCYLSQKLGCLEAIFLFLDELEKQGGLPTQVTLRYLSAIRALIDALPKYLFLMLAMTTEAHRRYSYMLPALAGRLQTVVSLSPLVNSEEAVQLYRFYLDARREAAKSNSQVAAFGVPGGQEPFTEDEVNDIFSEIKRSSEKAGISGVTQRAFLDSLHRLAEPRLA
jgi:hypothetical protein